ncbi:MAG TPA: acetyl-CoA C-acetyltransferase [Piscinibacter sp.]|jgi:acetyl-CoA C-acetyltransferase|uniref:acetyl-CoA C-acetyltransferase n=1 Tax=Piscinibacter sp. TaxID=1903157 RepID=UPI002C9BB60C|nr:acetyl-CoA C-acetyltransferase [Burkholderiaceae bacterium]HNK17474.1 acetyl-CoA C-acetyltransferase [Piscinibacter sp.]
MDTFIFDHVRTPRGRGKAGGSLHEVTPVWLASRPLVALAERNRLDTAAVEEVVMGCVGPVGEQGGNIGRIAVLAADWDQQVPGISIDRACGSGLEAVGFAASKVMAGQADLAVGAGVESLSRVPMGSSGGAWAQDPQMAAKTHFVMQGISADLLASLHGHSRTDLDAYAAESHCRAARAWSEGRFARSVVPVKDFIGLTLLERDETVRADTTIETLASLKPAFAEMGQKYGYDGVALQRYPQLERIEHHHHAGNSSGIVDGAAAVLVGNSAAASRHGLKARARIRSFAAIGSEPTLMLDGPAAAARRALDRAGMTPADIELWELNEAFSSVVLTFMEALAIPHERINVNGGAIAMGHPLGATGAMILGTALDELERSGKGTALVSLCVAAGMGSAMVIERI